MDITKAALAIMCLCVVRVSGTCDNVAAPQCFANLATMVDPLSLCSNLDSIEDAVVNCLAKIDTCNELLQDAYKAGLEQIRNAIDGAKAVCNMPAGCETTDVLAVTTDIAQCAEPLADMTDYSQTCSTMQTVLDCMDSAMGTCSVMFDEIIDQYLTSVASSSSSCDPAITYRGQPIVAADTTDCATIAASYMGCLAPLQTLFESSDSMEGAEYLTEMCTNINKHRSTVDSAMTCIEDIHKRCPDSKTFSDEVPSPGELLDTLGNFTMLCSPDCADLNDVITNSQLCVVDAELKYGVTSETFNASIARQNNPSFCTDSDVFRVCLEEALNTCPQQLAPLVHAMEYHTDIKPLTSSFMECSLSFSERFQPQEFANTATRSGVPFVLMVVMWAFIAR